LKLVPAGSLIGCVTHSHDHGHDHGDHLKGGLPGTKDEDGDRFIEIWNLVFMQFEQISKEKRINLPKP
jgi:alanyl-tRNA synthetase